MITADNLITKCQSYVNSISTRVEPEDWYLFFTDAIREVRRGRTFPEQRRNLTMDFFTNVFQYALPTDFDSYIKPHNRATDMYSEGPYMIYGRDKDFFANNNSKLGITFNAENKYLLARINGYSDLDIDTFEESATDYTLTGDASNATINSVDYMQGAGALQFDITSGIGSATISRTYTDPYDITDFINMGGSLFLWVNMPTVVDSLTIKLGTDNANYYQVATVTTKFTGEAFTTGWNLVRFDSSNKTTVGAPDTTNTVYMSITLNHTLVTDTGFEIDVLAFRLPTKMEQPYNSKNVVKATGALGAYKETVDNGTDILLLDETFEAVVMWKAVEYAAKWKYNDKDLEVQGLAEYAKAEKLLSRRYPSVEVLAQTNYYKRNRF